MRKESAGYRFRHRQPIDAAALERVALHSPRAPALSSPSSLVDSRPDHSPLVILAFLSARKFSARWPKPLVSRVDIPTLHHPTLDDKPLPMFKR
jgi:hypothetical protein